MNDCQPVFWKEDVRADQINSINVESTIYFFRNGADTTGLFVAMWIICDKITNEQEVDIFHAVKDIRMARPQFIPTQVKLLKINY